MTNTILLYRYLNQRAALKSLQQGNLRVSRISDLNDPFDFVPGIEKFPEEYSRLVSDHQDRWIKNFSQECGVICFSEVLTDPVMWAHYGDGHQGICFEFDYILGDTIWKVEYGEERPTADAEWVSNPSQYRKELRDFNQRRIVHKAMSWGYEKEYRVIVNLKEAQQNNGQYFLPIPDNFLKRVILGVRCTLSIDTVQMALRNGGLKNIEVAKAKVSPNKYRINVPD